MPFGRLFHRAGEFVGTVGIRSVSFQHNKRDLQRSHGILQTLASLVHDVSRVARADRVASVRVGGSTRNNFPTFSASSNVS
jgi:hypothetical protein